MAEKGNTSLKTFIHHNGNNNRNNNGRRKPANNYQNQNRNRRHLNTSNQSNSSVQPTKVKKQHLPILKISDYQLSKVYGDLGYQVPYSLPKTEYSFSSSSSSTQSAPVINELPKFPERPTAILRNTRLRGTYLESLNDFENPQRLSLASDDPAFQIVSAHKNKAKVLKLGDLDINIYTKRLPAKKQINKLLNKDSFASTPLKRSRNEVTEVSNSLKKNKRITELQHEENSMIDTTMELSFEGKAMDRSDLVKLVDSSVILPDESITHESSNSNYNGYFDTKNLLQSTEFNFEFR